MKLIFVMLFLFTFLSCFIFRSNFKSESIRDFITCVYSIEFINSGDGIFYLGRPTIFLENEIEKLVFTPSVFYELEIECQDLYFDLLSKKFGSTYINLDSTRIFQYSENDIGRTVISKELFIKENGNIVLLALLNAKILLIDSICTNYHDFIIGNSFNCDVTYPNKSKSIAVILELREVNEFDNIFIKFNHLRKYNFDTLNYYLCY